MASEFALWFSLTIFSVSLFGVSIPPYSRPLLDEVQLLTTVEVESLESKLQAMHDTGKISLAIYIAPSLFETSVEELAEQVFQKWALGKKGEDRGALLLIAPRERKMRLEVGYGLEAELTDAFSRRVLDDDLKPFFKDARYADGILKGLHSISSLLKVPLSGPVPRRPSLWEKIIANKNVHLIAWVMLIPACLVCLLGFFDTEKPKRGKSLLPGILAYGFLSLFLGVFFFVGLEEKAPLFIAIPGIFYLLIFILPIPIILFKRLFPSRFQAWDKALTEKAAAREAKRRLENKNQTTTGRNTSGRKSWWSSSSSGGSSSSRSSSFSSGGRSGGGGASSSW